MRKLNLKVPRNQQQKWLLKRLAVKIIEIQEEIKHNQ